MSNINFNNIDTYGRCTFCKARGHGADKCAILVREVASGRVTAIKFQNKLNGGRRLCGYCAGSGHSSTKCEKRFTDYRQKLDIHHKDCEKAFVWLHEIGFGPGAMLSGMARERRWSSRHGNKGEKAVIIENFSNRTLTEFLQELLYGSARNWYAVDAMDTSMEKVKNIYLPFHPVYSPRPTSMKVEVIHRANPEDIESLKQQISCYSNPVRMFATAKDFFDAGYKFKSGNLKTPEIIAPLTPKS